MMMGGLQMRFLDFSHRTQNRDKPSAASVRHTPYLTDGRVPTQYPWLDQHQSCDVCVIGDGLTAALCTLRLAERGRSVVMLADRSIGFGEDACLPVQVDADFGMTLVGMSRHFPMETSLRLLTLGSETLDELEHLCRSLDGQEGNDGFLSGFERRDSLLYTDDDRESALLEHEYRARRRHRFDCVRLSRETARDTFGFDIRDGLLSKGFGASLQPYYLLHLCLKLAVKHGAAVFEHCGPLAIDPPPDDNAGVRILAASHRTVYADRLIMATGSRGLRTVLPDICRFTHDCLITRPLSAENLACWPGRCHIRRFGNPHTSFAFTPDGRIAADRWTSRRLTRSLPFLIDSENRAAAQIEAELTALFSAVPTTESAYVLSQAYCIAYDGLPVIGIHPDYPCCVWALCSGPGTVLFALPVADAAADLAEEKPCEETIADLFSITR